MQVSKPAGWGDFPVARVARLSAPPIRATVLRVGKPGEPADWKVCATPAAGLVSRQPIRSRFNMNPAVQTAKYSKYTNGKGLGRKRAVTCWANRAFCATHSTFAFFAWFAVSTAIFKIGAPFLQLRRAVNKWRQI
jgi:hypothetical protein